MPPVLPLMKKPARLCLAAGTLFALFLTPLAQGRTWTNLQGKKLEAEFIRLDGQKAVLKRSGGQTVSIPLSQLSREELLDQGIRPNTIRLSIGTEHIDDIIADLEAGFAAVRGE